MERDVISVEGLPSAAQVAEELLQTLFKNPYAVQEDQFQYIDGITDPVEYQERIIKDNDMVPWHDFQELHLKDRNWNYRKQQEEQHPRTRDLNSRDVFGQKENSMYPRMRQEINEGHPIRDLNNFPERNPQTLTELLENSSPMDAKDTLSAVSPIDQQVSKYNPASFSTRLYLEPDLKLLRN